VSIFGTLFGNPAHARLVEARLAHAAAPMSDRKRYQYLEARYHMVGMYAGLGEAAYESGVWHPAMKGLRSPEYRVVEFYASKLWPGTLPDALPVITENDAIIPSIEQLWQWSNMNVAKQVQARWIALYGDAFWKVATTEDRRRVYLQAIKPEHVTDFDEDERGFMTYCRIDIPAQAVREGDKITYKTHTEVWDKRTQTVRRWLHDKAIDEDLDRLGAMESELPFSTWGIDFVPITHAPFKDIGEPRGQNSFTHALDKIDEANMQATRLHQMLFRHNANTWVLRANGNDPSGRPLPPPVLPGGSAAAPSDANTYSLGEERVWRLPGMSELQSQVPNINYDSALAIIKAQEAEILRDLPELLYYELAEKGELSGVALTRLMSGAIDRLIEVRGNAESGLIRAVQMALTIGQNAGLFAGLGTYEAGNFNFTFAEREAIPISDVEEAASVVSYVQAGVPLRTALRRAGWSDDELLQMEEDARPIDPMQQVELDRAKIDLEAEKQSINQDTVSARIALRAEQLAEMPMRSGTNGNGNGATP
jgi:hypothetical protein